MLSYSPMLGFHNARLSQVVQQGGFPVINMADDCHDRRPGNEIFKFYWFVDDVEALFLFNSASHIRSWNILKLAPQDFGNFSQHVQVSDGLSVTVNLTTRLKLKLRIIFVSFKKFNVRTYKTENDVQELVFACFQHFR